MINLSSTSILVAGTSFKSIGLSSPGSSITSPFISTSESVSKSQEKIENQCKEILINFFLNYLHEYKISEEEKAITLANKINGKK